jgi:Ca2+-binding EF-hand superfamily protein
MIAKLMVGMTFLLGSAVMLSGPATAKDTTVDAALMKTLDPDGDGTVDLAEAKAAGAAMFKKLNTDDDDTLSMKELGDRVSADEFKAADPDGDGTLDEAEYADLVETLFKAADPDDDGTLDEAELKSAAGQKLLAVIA